MDNCNNPFIPLLSEIHQKKVAEESYFDSLPNLVQRQPKCEDNKLKRASKNTDHLNVYCLSFTSDVALKGQKTKNKTKPTILSDH